MPLFRLEIDHAIAGTRRSVLVLADDEDVAALGAGVSPDEVARINLAHILEAGTAGLRASRLPGAQDMAGFYQVVHDCLRIGMVLPAALEMAAAQQTVPRLGGVIGHLIRDIRAGSTFSDAVRRHPEIFDATTVGLIHAGEVSDGLENVFGTLAKGAQRRGQMIAQLRKSAAYPCAVLVLMVLVMLYVSVTLVPSMARTYEQFGANLPWITQFVVTASALIRGEPLLWVVVLGLVAAIWSQRHHIIASQLFQDFTEAVPVLGRLLGQLRLARILRTLGMLLGVGVRTPDAFELAAVSAGNARLAAAMRDVSERVTRGEELAHAFARNQRAIGADGARLVAFLRVGSRVGKPDAVFNQLADEAEIAVERTVSLLDKLIEPLLLSILAVGVGGLLFAVYFPLFNLGNALLKQ
jgi:type IV pilus assembly protein PilC